MRRLIRQTTRAGVPPLLLHALRCDRMPLQMSSLRKQGPILPAPSIGCGVWVPALRPLRGLGRDDAALAVACSLKPQACSRHQVAEALEILTLPLVARR